MCVEQCRYTSMGSHQSGQQVDYNGGVRPAGIEMSRRVRET